MFRTVSNSQTLERKVRAVFSLGCSRRWQAQQSMSSTSGESDCTDLSAADFSTDASGSEIEDYETLKNASKRQKKGPKGLNYTIFEVIFIFLRV